MGCYPACSEDRRAGDDLERREGRERRERREGEKGEKGEKGESGESGEKGESGESGEGTKEAVDGPGGGVTDDAGALGVAGMILTGGTSSRFGFDKASIIVDGEPLAARVARVLSAVVRPVVEVGPGRSGLRAVVEGEPGRGPLAAIGAGHKSLFDDGHRGPTLVLACDLPNVERRLLSFLAGWAGESSVVPVVSGEPQPLCARWSRRHLDSVASMIDAGHRSMRSLLAEEDVEFLDERSWVGVASAATFADVDRREDFEHLGLHWSLPESPSEAAGGPGLEWPPRPRE
jgi:molybdenum cofactor guanylyltransferase